MNRREWTILKRFNNTLEEIPFVPVTEQVLRQAERQPEACAVIVRERKISYRMLERMIRKIAAALLFLGVREEHMVGLVLERSEWIPAAEHGIMLSGAAFIPMVPEYPDERIRVCMELAKSRLLITSQKIRDSRPELCGMGFSVKTIEELLEMEVPEQTLPTLRPDQLAACLFTSGSTGVPKGVLLEHHTFSNNVVDHDKNLPYVKYIRSGQTVMTMTPSSFSVSVTFDQLALCNGRTICVADEAQLLDFDEAVRLILEHGVTSLFCTPSYLAALMSMEIAAPAMDRLRCVLMGGEGASLPLLHQVLQDRPKLSVLNGYGCTETAAAAVFKEITLKDQKISIGRPLINEQVLVFDEEGNVLPPGEKGEMVIFGQCVARGYLELPEETDRAFLTTRSGRKGFRTGDVAMWNENGEIEIFGRTDDQVNLNGIRVELQEIEHALAGYPGLINCRITLRKEAGEFLAAFYTAETSLEPEILKKYLEERLPSYMIPAVLVQLPEMPKNVNGKVDRKKLNEMPLTSPQSASAVSAGEESEGVQLVRRAVENLLETEGLHPDDNLIACGMDSLSAMKLSSLLEQQSSFRIPAAQILRTPSIHALGQWIENRKILSKKENRSDSAAAFDAEQKMKDAAMLSSEEADWYPMTENQTGVYLEWEKNPEGTQYNITLCCGMEDVEPEQLAEAARKTVDAHEQMKMRLTERDGMICQESHAEEPAVVTIADPQDREAPDEEFLMSLIQPFDLFRDRLYRIQIIPCRDRVYFFMDVHHILFDGISADLFLSDLRKACAGKTLEPERMTAREFSLQEKELLEGSLRSTASVYYENLLEGVEIASVPGSAAVEGEGAGKVFCRMPAEAVNAFCVSVGVTASSFWQAAFSETLHRMTRKNAFFYVTAGSGRMDQAGLERTTGMFVRTLPVVCRLEPELHAKEAPADYVRRMHAQLMTSCTMELYPYADIVEKLGLQAEIMMIYQGGLTAGEASDSLLKHEIGPAMAKFPLELMVYPDEGEYCIRILYDRSLYSSRDVELLGQAMCRAAEGMASAAQSGGISLVSEEEGLLLMERSMGEVQEFDRTETWVDHFRRRAAETPDKIAVTDGTRQRTYCELEKDSAVLAAYLTAKGIGPGEFAAVHMGRTAEYVTAVLGIHRAGAAYIAVDNTYPQERIQYILEDSQAALVLNEESLSRILSEGRDNAGAVEDTTLYHRSAPEQAAYMAYTSGSTGRPKGIVMSHRAMLNFVMFINRRFHISEQSRQCCHCSFSSDVSLESIFTSLTSGGTVVIAPEEIRRDLIRLRQFLREQRVTGGSYFTQTGQLLGAEGTLDLDYIALIGEQMTSVPDVTGTVFNTYGPTEFIEATYYEVDKNREYHTFPIGRPMDNCSAYILDQYSCLLPDGMAGEICLAGPQLAEGYWGMPEKTAQVFTEIQLPGGQIQRIYHTGDQGRRNEEGELEFLGRLDFQIKLRGYRIEPGEVEAAAAAMEGMKQVVVVVKNDQLCLYYTADRTISDEELRSFMAERLAVYMVPSVFTELESMPLTPNGKINRERLPEPSFDRGELIAPETEREQQLFAIAAELLQTDLFGVTDNLISVGLSSIGAMKLSTAVKRRTGCFLRVAEILREPVIRRLAVLMEDSLRPATLLSCQTEGFFPLSENQKGIYLEWELHPHSTQYNIPFVYRFEGMDAPALKQAVLQAAEAHPGLRTALSRENGEVLQRMEEGISIRIEEAEMLTELDGKYFQTKIRPFDLFAEPLFRFELVKSPQAVYLFMDFHHLIFDGLSADLFMEDVQTVLAGGTPEQEMMTPFAFASYEQLLMENGGMKGSGEYFDSLIEGTEALVYPGGSNPMPSDKKEELVPSVRSRIPMEQVVSFCRRSGVTESSFWHTAFAETLRRLTGEQELMYLTISGGRAALEGLERTAGMFARTIPVVWRSGDRNGTEGSVKEALQNMHHQLQESIGQDLYSYAALAERHQLKPGIMFLYQGGMLEGGNLNELMDLQLKTDTVRFPVDVTVFPSGEDYLLQIEYDSSEYEAEEMQLLADAVVHAAQSLTVEEKLKNVRLVTDREQEELLVLSRGESFVYDETETWLDRFERCVQEHPDRDAVSDGSGVLTYRELDELSEKMAQWLLTKGVEPNDFIAVQMDRTRYFSAAVMGIHKAGAAYVPMDLDQPEERVRLISEDSGARIVLDDATAAGIFRQDNTKEQNSSSPANEEGERRIRRDQPDRLAYMIYTSGSTGMPKGVMISHRALNNFVHFLCRKFELNADSRISCHVNFAFDASVEDLFPILTVGGTLFIVPETVRRDVFLMRQFIQDHRITGGNYSTQFGQLLTAEGTLDLEYINLGGEKMTAVPDITGRVFNTYGPTEFTDDATWFELDKNRIYRNIPIGRPLDNCTALVADCCGQLLPRGAAGELCLSGPQLGEGYWNRPELTAEAFSLLSEELPVSVYHTGDLVRWNNEDQLEYLGRMDFQVKLRGYRVEPGEIEALAASFEGIRMTAAVVYREQLALYYEADQHVDQEALRTFLQNSLADYMVPSIFIQLEQMPLTQNGKIDRKHLPEPSGMPMERIAPQTELEQQILSIAQELLLPVGQAEQQTLLGTEDEELFFGVTDDLISLGLSSLGAMRLSTEVHRRMNRSLRVAAIMLHPTVRQLAAVLEQAEKEGDDSSLSVLRPYPKQEWYPLTENQRGVYIDWEMSRETTEYNNPRVYTFTGGDADRLENALQKVMACHPYLKTRIGMVDGQVCQQRRDEDAVEITRETLTGEPELSTFQKMVIPFDLMQEKLYRFTIFESPEKVCLFMDLHHIIFDGLSSDLFFRDLMDAYSGKALDPETVSAFDAALFEQEQQSEKEDIPPYFDQLIEGSKVASYPVSLEPDEVDVCVVRKTVSRSAVEEYSRKEGVTVSSCWHAAFSEALHRLTRELHPLYITVSSGRTGIDGMDRTAGMFARTLPVVQKTAEDHGDESVRQYVRDFHEQLQQTFALDTVSFVRLAEQYRLSTEIMFNYRGGLMDAGELQQYAESCGLSGITVTELMPDAVKFPLELTVWPEKDQFILEIEYDGIRYSRADMEMLAGAIVDTAVNMTKAEIISDVCLVSEEGQDEIVRLSKGKTFDYDASETWLDMFFRQVALRPDHEAVADEFSSLSYAELDDQSDRFAVYLQRQGIRPNDFVVCRMGRVKEFMVAVLGIHKAGAAYVPVDLEYPPERVRYMLENSEAAVTATQELVFEALEEVPFVTEKPRMMSPDTLAYMIYTSGSTGRPKGVMIPQSALLNFVHCIRDTYGITSESRISMPKNFAFDASIEDLFPVLTVGGMVFIVPEKERHDVVLLREFLKERRINGGGYPTQLGQMVGADETLNLDYMTAGGEAMTMVPSITGDVYNVYGPTEFTDDAIYFKVDKNRTYRNIPIGRPLYNNYGLVVDRYNQLLPQGAMGELCLSGPQMSRGYWKLPELTAEKFTILNNRIRRKVYHTGDLVRWNDEWQMEYMGRIDFQVKLKGYRVELGEIEARAAKFEGMKQEVAVLKKDRLCLYYTAELPIDPEELRSFIAESLAEFMVPVVYVQLEKMPLTPNGKIDRSALPEPEIRDEEMVAPSTPEEGSLLEIAQELLGETGFGVTSQLISLGLNSLGAMRFSMEVQKRMGRPLRVADIMRRPTVRELAAILVSGDSEDAGLPKLTVRPVQAYYPLTENQRGIYLDWEMDRSTTQYNDPLVYRFTDRDAQVLADAVRRTLDAHSYFKMRLAIVDGEVVQQRHDDEPSEVTLSVCARRPEKEDFQQKVRPFHLFEERLYRIEVIDAPGEVDLFIDLHHILFDGLSADLLLRDILAACDGVDPEPETITAYDFALYEKELTGSRRFAEAEEYFDRQMTGVGALSFAVPGNRSSESAGPDQDDIPAPSETAVIDGNEIDEFCRREGITISSYWHAAFAEAMQRLTGMDSFFYVTVSSGRAGTAGLENTVGMFAKTIPVVIRPELYNLQELKDREDGDSRQTSKVTDPAAAKTGDYVRSLHEQLQETLALDFYPYTRIVERHQQRAEILFLYQGGVMEGGNTAESAGLDLTLDKTKFPIDITVYPAGDQYLLKIGYDGARYDADSMRLLAKTLIQAASSMASAETLKDVQLVPEEERAELLTLSTGEALNIDPSETWVDAFLRHVQNQPDHIAAADCDSALTYGELSVQSGLMAAWLLEQGIAEGDFIALRMNRRKEFVTAVLAAHRVGAAYVPIDPSYPEERIRYMLEDSGAALVLTDEEVRIVIKEKQEARISEAETAAENLLNRSAPEQIAYMIYTSGSTGQPKGVLQTHRALRAFTSWREDKLELSPDSRLAQHTSFAFDASLDDLICPLTAGGSVHILEESLRQDLDGMVRFFREENITGLTLPTQLGMLLINTYPELPLHYLMMGGEALRSVKNTGVRLINGYGPTEFTVCSSFHEVDQKKDGESIPIGRPVPGSQSLICDSRGGLLPRGIAGELCLAGPQCTEGYWKQPELTKALLTEIHLSPEQTVTVCKTGDLARWDENGELIFCGRRDDQQKLRGYRIEPGEIERTAVQCPGVQEAAAVIREQHLYLYYTEEKTVTAETLREFLQKRLPSYMIPDGWIRLDAMPLTPNGKRDLSALPKPEMEYGQNYEAPSNRREAILGEAVRDILGLKEMPGVQEDFFMLGGDSIKAIRLVSELRSQGMVLTAADILKQRTIRAAAAVCRVAEKHTDIEKKPVEGRVPDSAIVRFFRSLELPVLSHFNQPVLLRCSVRVDASELQKVIDAMSLQHDMLRAVYINNVLEIRPFTVQIPVEEQSVESEADITEACEAVQTGLNLRESLLRVVLLHGPEHDWLFLAAHHLITDGVSWRILLSDLEEGFRQIMEGKREVILPAGTSTYIDYTNALQEYRNSWKLRREQTYWQNVQKEVEKISSSDRRSHRRTMMQWSVQKDEAWTKKFRQSSVDRIGADRRDLLTAAVCRSFCRVTGQPDVSIELEGHGRDSFGSNLVLDRTVGWFTSFYPVVFKELSGDPKQDLLCVKETLHRVPEQGIGYPVLSYLEGSSNVNWHPEQSCQIALNYLGEIGTENDREEDTLFTIEDRISMGASIAPSNVFGPDLTINSVIQNGCFDLSVEYNKEKYTEEDIHRLAEGIFQEIEALSDWLSALETPVVTPSDLGENEWSLEEFEALRRSFEQRGERIQRIYPLTPMQEAMLLKHIAEPEEWAYRIADLYELDFVPSEDELRQAAARLAECHQVLRTAILYKGISQYRQAIIDRIPSVRMVDLSGINDRETQRQRILAIREEILSRDFDLQNRPLLQFTCIRTSESRSELILAVHHMIVDGWCTDLYMNDFRQLLDEARLSSEAGEGEVKTGRTMVSAAGNRFPSGPYEEAVREMQNFDMEKASAYWKQLLDGYAEKAEIPSYGEVPEHERSREAQMTGILNPVQTAALKELCREAGATFSNGVELLWGLVLQTCSRRQDVVFAKVVSGRDKFREDVSGIVGLFINSIPVRLQSQPEDTARQLLQKLQRQTAESNPYDFCPLSVIQEQTIPGSQLLQSVMAFENYDSGRNPEEGPALSYTMTPVMNVEEPFGELNMTAYVDEEEQLCIRLTFDRKKYRAFDIEQVLRLFRVLADGIVRQPDQPLSDLRKLSAEEEQQMLSLSKGEELSYPAEEIWLDGFLRQVEKGSDRLAVTDRSGSLTYRELDAMSEAVAAELIRSGVKPDDFVIVKTGRVKEFVIAVTAIHKAGAAYVPVDPAYPAERIQYMIEHSGAEIILTEETIRGMADSTGILSAELPEAVTNRIHRSSPSCLAYMIYTSGSTGTPKGVLLKQDGLMNFTAASIRQNELTPADRIGHHFSFSFDSHIEDVFPVLASGASIHIMEEEIRRDPDAIYRFLVDNEITGGGFTTSMGRLLITGYELPQRYITCIGEPLTGVTAGAVRIFNKYGPTECTNVCSVYELEQGRSYTSIPIGRPVPNSWCFLVDEHNHLVPAGTAGELCFAGIQTGVGYWKMEDKTAEVYEDCPFVEGLRMYHTGDLARYNERGELECLGRIDQQIKLRGYRIEPGEIEACASEIPGVKETAVVVRQDKLCLYYTMEDDRSELSADAAPTEADQFGGDGDNNGTEAFEQVLRNYLEARLAEYMMPSVIIALEEMPRTPNGKTDRRALPDPVFRPEVENLPPETPEEAAYLQIAAELLPDIEFGPTDDLMALGMNSIQVMKLVMKLSQLDRTLRVSDIMRYRTIRRILQGTRQICWFYSEYNPSQPVIASLQGIMPLNGMMSKYEEWDRWANVLILEPTDDHYEQLLTGKSYDEIMDYYDQILKEILPEGAVITGFIGSSWGGELSYQLACRQYTGEGTAPFVMMLDTHIDDRGADFRRTPADASEFTEDFLERFAEHITPESFAEKINLMLRLETTQKTLMPYEGSVVYLNAWKGYTAEERKEKLQSLYPLFDDLTILDCPEKDHYDLFMDPSMEPMLAELIQKLLNR